MSNSRQYHEKSGTTSSWEPVRAKQFWVAAVQPVLPDGWLLMEQLHGRSYYYHKNGASQLDKPTARVPDEEPEERLRAWATGDSAYDNYY